jgi:glycosyltransferase involved in cell wall biosynthesis
MAVAGLVRRHGYDVVHQHLEASGYWYSRAALSAGAGVVRTLHNNFPFEGWLRRVRGWQRRNLAKRGVQFASIAPGVQHNELTRFGTPTSLVVNWMDDRFMSAPTLQQRLAARGALGFGDEDFVLVSVGNCSPVKNHAVILQALARCSDLPHIRYLHVGVEEPDHPEQELSRELGVEARVNFAGWQPDALPMLRAADAFIMPSLFEGLSIAALEALGTGLPGLLAKSPGLLDLADLFRTLEYFSPTIDDAERAIRQIVGEGPEARAVRTRHYTTVCGEHFSARRGVREYAALYERALARQGARRGATR